MLNTFEITNCKDKNEILKKKKKKNYISKVIQIDLRTRKLPILSRDFEISLGGGENHT